MRALAAIFLLGSCAHAQENLALQDVVAIKDATVLILRTHAGDEGDSSGSGFLIRVDGRTGYIVTNNHVIGSPKGVARDRGTTRIVFRSGTKAERKVPAEVVATSPEKDLAILRVADVPDLPAPIDVQKPTELVETMPVYIFGFPFGEMLVPDRGKISVVVGKGSVSSVRRDDEGTPRSVLIDGALNPGNSGGPVVDAKGRLVGVAVATIPGAHIGIAIAPPELLAILEGRAEGVNVAVGEAREGVVDLAVEVSLVDPLGRLKSMSFLGVPNGTMPTRGRKEKDWKPLAGAKTIALKVAGQKGRGTLTIPSPAGQDVDLVYQLALTDSQGQVIHKKPGRYVLARAADAGHLDAWGEAIDPDGDCKIRVEKRAVAFEVPGTYHDLNSEYGKFNAPRVWRDVEGDFVAQVKVCGEFQPGEPTTRDSAVPSNGAGLVVWLDAETFIRFERFGILRNQKISPFLLFERREVGQVKSNHNGRLDSGDVYLKIERRGGRITGAFSADGQTWTRSKPMEIEWPARLKVGLDAVSSSFEPFAVRFEEFSIRKPEVEK